MAVAGSRPQGARAGVSAGVLVDGCGCCGWQGESSSLTVAEVPFYGLSTACTERRAPPLRSPHGTTPPARRRQPCARVRAHKQPAQIPRDLRWHTALLCRAVPAVLGWFCPLPISACPPAHHPAYLSLFFACSYGQMLPAQSKVGGQLAHRRPPPTRARNAPYPP